MGRANMCLSYAHEVVCEGVGLLERRQAEDAIKLEALRAALDPAIADMKAGRTTPVPAGRELETILALAGASREA
jgi:hypothetical protein